MSQPWAIKRDVLSYFTQLALDGDQQTAPRENISSFSEGRYNGFNYEAAARIQRGELSATDDNTHVFLVWGILGRAWSEEDRFWFDPVDVDDLVRAIAATPEGSRCVLWFRSPGGVSAGIPESAAALRELGATRELVAFTDDICASAAYWLASQCSEIVATQTASVGSIGVYTAFYDWCEYLEKMGVKLELFKSGRLKASAMMGNPLSAEEREHFQANVSRCYEKFTADVLRNRDIDFQAMQGQVFEGESAKAANLVDRFSASHDAFFKTGLTLAVRMK